MNMQQVETMAMRVVGDMGGTFTMSLAYIGDQLGLFRTMATSGPVTSEELASTMNLNERYVREWLRAMVASEYLERDATTGRYRMTEEQAAVLANEDSPMFCGGAFHFTTPSIYNTPRVMEAFRNGGGVPYHEMSAEIPCAIERFFRPGYVNFLVSHWLPAVPGLMEKLQAGARVADIGCGRGQSTVRMAEAFPKSTFVGIDYHEPSIAAATRLAKDRGLSNTEFVRGPAERLPMDRTYDLVCSFDCIHDMVDPVATLKTIRMAMSDDGVYLWSEPNASHEEMENRNPIGRAFHSISPLHCMTVSLAHDGAGLGTVIGEQGARKLASEAGFGMFGRLPIDNPFNQFFLLRK
ncbi:MAG: class I SAM-dependent methyltransferase [Bryobacteraceae bacterium]